MNRFGISTHLFHEHRLSRDHLVHIAAHGFEAIELFATRSHFDYHDEQAIAALAEWLSDTRLEVHSVHAPIVQSLKGGKWIDPFSNAIRDEANRTIALQEAAAAIALARHIPYRHLVVHLGTPTTERVAPNDNQPELARRTVEELFEKASRENVRLALEVIPNALSSPEALVHLIEEELDGIDVGICLDYGHAHLMGDLGEAIETVSGHLLTTHVHDNGGTRDDHLVPYGGSIDWDVAMMETQKIGYDGTLMFEVADSGHPVTVLERCIKARDRLTRTFVTFDEV